MGRIDSVQANLKAQVARENEMRSCINHKRQSRSDCARGCIACLKETKCFGLVLCNRSVEPCRRGHEQRVSHHARRRRKHQVGGTAADIQA